jgi:hypothetical protein
MTHDTSLETATRLLAHLIGHAFCISLIKVFLKKMSGADVALACVRSGEVSDQF